jgi:hypothetical protein
MIRLSTYRAAPLLFATVTFLYRYLPSQIQLTAAQPVLDSSAATIPFAGLPPPHHCDAKDSYYHSYYSFRSRFRLEIGGEKSPPIPSGMFYLGLLSFLSARNW